MINIAGMSPALHAVQRGFMLTCADYIGGRLHGLLSPAGLHELRRDENSRGIDAETAGRMPHYRLYVDGSVLHYIHSSLVPPPGNDLQNHENDSDRSSHDRNLMRMKRTKGKVMNTLRPWRTVSVVPLAGTWANRYRRHDGRMIHDPCPAILVQERGGESRAAFATYYCGELFAAIDTNGYEESSCAGGPRSVPYRADRPPWELLDEEDPVKKAAEEAARGVPLASSFIKKLAPED